MHSFRLWWRSGTLSLSRHFFSSLHSAFSRQLVPFLREKPGAFSLDSIVAQSYVQKRSRYKKGVGRTEPHLPARNAALSLPLKIYLTPSPTPGILLFTHWLKFFGSALTLRAVFPACVLGCGTLQSSFWVNMLLFPAFRGLVLIFSSANTSFKKCISRHFKVFGLKGETDEYTQSITLIQSLLLLFFKDLRIA